jgi:hypothetical protein
LYKKTSIEIKVKGLGAGKKREWRGGGGESALFLTGKENNFVCSQVFFQRLI